MATALDIMKTSVATVGEDTPLIEAIRLLLDTNQRALPVVDDQNVILGIISEGDFLCRQELGGLPPPSLLETLVGSLFDKSHDRSTSLRVGDVMTSNPACVNEDDGLEEIVALMERNRIAQVPVVSGPFVIGLITRAELLFYIERQMRGGDANKTTDATA